MDTQIRITRIPNHMKNIKFLFTLGAILSGLAASSSANLYTDTNIHNVDVFEGQSVSGQWSYGPIGAGETVVGVETWFKFSSGDNDYEQVHLDLGTGEGPVDYSYNSSTFNFGPNYTIHWNFNSPASLLADAANGFLSYEITSTNKRGLDNDFTFAWAKVNVTTTACKVPEGGATVAMLGLGLLGFFGLQRKFQLAR